MSKCMFVTGDLKYIESPAAYYMYTSALMFTSLSGAHACPPTEATMAETLYSSFDCSLQR